MAKLILKHAGLCLALCLLHNPVSAQEVQGAYVSIELNAAQQPERSGRISFLVQNEHSFEIDGAVYEALIFGIDGRVDRLTLLDFGALPSERPSIKQFVVPNLANISVGVSSSLALKYASVQTCQKTQAVTTCVHAYPAAQT